jgi:hypothetical protein
LTSCNEFWIKLEGANETVRNKLEKKTIGTYA